MWTTRIIKGRQIGERLPPIWLVKSHAIFHELVVRIDYPCYFGSHAERAGELYYSYVEGEVLDDLPLALKTFIDHIEARKGERNNLAVFFEPHVTPLRHDQYRQRFWHCLQFLYDRDPARTLRPPLVPSDHLWEFPFGGVQFFVVGTSPSYARRHSRNLGPGMVLLFQPRHVFIDAESGKPIGDAARVRVRRRLAAWDAVAAHPDLNVYGDLVNREWKQYFLSDDASVEAAQCPLNVHGAARPAREPALAVGSSARDGADHDETLADHGSAVAQRNGAVADRVGAVADGDAPLADISECEVAGDAL